MKKLKLIMILSAIALTSCGQQTVSEYFPFPGTTASRPVYLNEKPLKKTVQLEYKIRDINLPNKNCIRIYNDEYSLRLTSLKLKISNQRNETHIYEHNGTYVGKAPYIIDVPVNKFQDCAAMAMYVHALSKNESISVHDANGKAYPINTSGSNLKSMSMCNSYSIQKYDVEYAYVPIDKVMPGDMFITGGHPGHVATILDVVRDTLTNFKYIMVGQGWLPACDMHVVYNQKKENVWFNITRNKTARFELLTEHTYYNFEAIQLRRWKNR